MQGFFSVSAVQFKRVFGKREFWFALTASLALFALAYFELVVHYIGAVEGAIPSAGVAWVANMHGFLLVAPHLYYFLFIFVLSSMAFGDAFYLDVKSRHIEHLLSRCSLRCYLISTTVVAFLSGALVVAIPLTVFQLLSMIAFPILAEPWSFSGNLYSDLYGYTWIYNNAQGALFRDLMYDAPYAYNALLIAYDSLWGGIAAVVSIAVSCYTRKSRLLIVGAPTFVFLLAFFLLKRVPSLQFYLFPNIIYFPLFMSVYVGAPLVVLMFSVALIWLKRARGGEMLL